jgi:sialate O-acetylesterase
MRSKRPPIKSKFLAVGSPSGEGLSTPPQAVFSSDQYSPLAGKKEAGATCEVVLLRLLITVLIFASCWDAQALELARPFGAHMVLPMNRRVPVWGKAMPGVEVTVTFGETKVSGKADAAGTWRVVLPAMNASAEGRTLLVFTSAGSMRKCVDVLVGEAWLCAGQSNMDFHLARAIGGKDEVAAAGSLPSIRLFNLTGVSAGRMKYGERERSRLVPGKFFEGEWQLASPESAARFSAVAWWAGKEIHRKSGIPVGLIDNSVGGSGAEAWLPREMLEVRAEYAELLGDDWIQSNRVSAWARERVAYNLGGKPGNHPFRPGFLFDAGVRWWSEFPLDGVLWYQGETNAEIYDDAWNELLITDLVTGWRRNLRQLDLPFIMVQLPRIGGNDPIRKWWPQFREAQARVAEKMEGVEIVVTKDLGWDSSNVHPPDKRPVGERLGQAAAGP